MSKLVKFIHGDGTPVLIDPSFIREVSGGIAGTIIVVERKDDKGEYVTHHFPISVSEAVRLIELARE